MDIEIKRQLMAEIVDCSRTTLRERAADLLVDYCVAEGLCAGCGYEPQECECEPDTMQEAKEGDM